MKDARLTAGYREQPEQGALVLEVLHRENQGVSPRYRFRHQGSLLENLGWILIREIGQLRGR